MNIKSLLVVVITMLSFFGLPELVRAAEDVSVLEKSMSDTLDVWRDGRYEQLFELLAHRGKTSREKFVKLMRESKIRPACCWQKMEHFRVLNEKRTEATVYVKIGLEGASDGDSSTTREFKLTHQDGVWKMQLADVISISGVTGKKNKASKRHSNKKSPYNN